MHGCALDRTVDRARGLSAAVRIYAETFAQEKGLPLSEWQNGRDIYYDFALAEEVCTRVISVRLSFALNPVELEVRMSVSRRDAVLLRHKGFSIARARAPRDLERLPDWLRLAFHCMTITKAEDMRDVVPDEGLENLAVPESHPLFDLYEEEFERDMSRETRTWRTPREK